VFVPIQRLAALFSVIDGQLWLADETGLQARFADCMAINQIPPREARGRPYLESLRGE